MDMKRDYASEIDLLGGYFVGNTYITMGDLSEKKIKDINVGEEVVNHLGQKRKVIKKFVRKYTGKLAKIKIKSIDYPFYVTLEQPIAIRYRKSRTRTTRILEDGFSFVSVGEIQLNREPYVVVPKLLNVPENNWEYIDLRKIIEEELHYNEETGRIWAVGTSEEYSVPAVIKVTPELMRLLGLFFAEGSYSKNNKGGLNGIRFTFERNEDELVEFVVQTIKSIFGVNPYIKKHKKRPSVVDVALSNNAVAYFFKKMCGEYSYGKELSPVLLNQPIELRRELLLGWLQGDGTSVLPRYKNNDGSLRSASQIEGVTISERLHRDMFRLSMSSNLKPSCKVRNNSKRGKPDSRPLVYYSTDVLALVPEWEEELKKYNVAPTGRVHYAQDEDNYYIKIESMEFEDVDNIDVYNLEVETDHAYIANFVLVQSHTANVDKRTEFVKQRNEEGQIHG